MKAAFYSIRACLRCFVVIMCTASCSKLWSKTYYVSSSAGSLINSGTSPESPWLSIAQVNAVELAPGDHIMLKAGDRFSDGLEFSDRDRGTADRPVVVGIYGGAAAAVVAPPPGSDGVAIHNTAGIVIRGLRLERTGRQDPADKSVGVRLRCDLPDGRKLSRVDLESLEISSFYRGILIEADQPSYSGFADVLVEGCRVDSCVADGIVSLGHKGEGDRQSHRNIQVRNCRVSNCRGDPTLKGSHSGSGIIVSGVAGGLIDRCVAHDNGGGAVARKSGGGPVGIWCWGCDRVTIQHCVVFNQRTTPGVMDGGGFDIDGGATHCIIQYCYSFNNDGYGYLVCEFRSATPLTHAIVRHNISKHDGRVMEQSGLGLYNGHPSVDNCREIVFQNNIVISDAAAGAAVKFSDNSNPAQATFIGNIFVRTAGARIVHIDRHMEGLTFQGNSYWSTSALPEWQWGEKVYTSLNDWSMSEGRPETINGMPVGVFADPSSRLAMLAHYSGVTAELAQIAHISERADGAKPSGERPPEAK